MELNKKRRQEHSTSVRPKVSSGVINDPLEGTYRGNTMGREREDDAWIHRLKCWGLAKIYHQRLHMQLGVVGGLR